MSNAPGLFVRLGMTRGEFEALAERHWSLLRNGTTFTRSDGYVMTEEELEAFCTLFKSANLHQQVLLASMLRFIQKEISKEAA
jgi:hypothetical protein